MVREVHKRRVRDKAVKQYFTNLSKQLRTIYGDDFHSLGQDKYFIFEQDVYDFTLKCTKGWIYRIWLRYDKSLEEDYLPSSHVFLLEHYSSLDKFKPTHVINQARDIQEFQDLVRQIQKYPTQSQIAAYIGLPIYFPAYEVDDTWLEDILDSKGHKTGKFKECYTYRGYQKRWDSQKQNFYQDFSVDKARYIQEIFTEYHNYKRTLQRSINYFQNNILPGIIANIFNMDYRINGLGLADNGNKCSPRYTLFLNTPPRYENKYNEVYDRISSFLHEVNLKLDNNEEYLYSGLKIELSDRVFTNPWKLLYLCRYTWYRTKKQRNVRYRRIQVNKQQLRRANTIL